MYKLQHRIKIVALIVIILGVLSVGVAFALTGTTIKIAGYMNMEFTDELTGQMFIPVSNSEIVVVVSANDETVPNQPYFGILYFDGIEVAAETIVWDDIEIPGGIKRIRYNGLDMVGATDITVVWLGQ